MHAIVAGPDPDGIGDALADRGVDVTRVHDIIDRPALEEAGIVDAALYVLTDVGQATSIPVACDLTDEIRTVVYARDTVPEFVRGQLDLALDPRLLEPALVAEELTG